MPLEAGSDDETVARNARKLISEGYPAEQAWAIAYDKAGRKNDQRSRHERTMREHYER